MRKLHLPGFGTDEEKYNPDHHVLLVVYCVLDVPGSFINELYIVVALDEVDHKTALVSDSAVFRVAS